MTPCARLTALVVCLLSAAATASSSPTKQFKTVVEMLEGFKDWTRTDGSLQVISEHPVHIRLVEKAGPRESIDVIRNDLKQAVIYALFSAFVFTPIESLTVTAVPGLVREGEMTVTKLLEDQALTVSLGRHRALALVREYCGIQHLGELVEARDYGGSVVPNVWIDCFNNLMYDDEGLPGHKRFFESLVR